MPRPGPLQAWRVARPARRQYDENGEELLNYWFSGFYPAQAPRYTVTVLQDGVLKPELSSAAIFEKITEILHVWDAAL